MGQVLIRDVPERLIDVYKVKARLKGTSVEQVLREVLESNACLTPEERATLARLYVAEFTEPVPALAKEEVREGLL